MDLSLNLAQKQVLSQKMQQSAEILQMSSLDLSDYIKELEMENPFIECEWEEHDKEMQKEFRQLQQKLDWLHSSDEQNRRYYQQEWGEEREEWNFAQDQGESLQEYLLAQINILPVKGKSKGALRYLAQCMEPSGYLLSEELEIVRNKFGLSQMETLHVLETLQSLEPCGVGARSVKECLLIQLRKQKEENPLCEKIILYYLEEFAKNHLQQIAKKLHVKLEDVVSAGKVIRTLNPKPGSGFGNTEDTRYIFADVFIFVTNGDLQVFLAENGVPRLKINGYYKQVLLNDSGNCAKEYVSKKVQQAKWVMQCIEKRNSTLLKTTQAMAQWQYEFFVNPDGQLRPMRLFDIAEMISMHESTVSRAIRGKYVQCDRGVLPLTYFFTTGLSTNHEDQVSAESVKQKMISLIEAEDKKKPFSDRKIGEELEKLGIKISRRTVAKYRESLGIAGASGRKRFE